MSSLLKLVGSVLDRADDAAAKALVNSGLTPAHPTSADQLPPPPVGSPTAVAAAAVHPAELVSSLPSSYFASSSSAAAAAASASSASPLPSVAPRGAVAAAALPAPSPLGFSPAPAPASSSALTHSAPASSSPRVLNDAVLSSPSPPPPAPFPSSAVSAVSSSSSSSAYPVAASPSLFATLSAFSPSASFAATPSSNHLDTAAAGSANSSLADEVVSLRAVWQETREKLDKARAELRDMRGKYEEKRREQERLHEAHVAEIKDRHQKELLEYKGLLSGNQGEFDIALKSKDEVLVTQEKQIQSMYKQIQSYHDETESLRQRMSQKEKEFEAAKQSMQELAEKHSEALHSLRDEFLKRETQLEQERKMQSSTLSVIQNRESSLEKHNVEYVNALAESQRNLQERDAKLQRLSSELEWMKADKLALENQLATAKARMEDAQKQAAKSVEQHKERSATLSDRVDVLSRENQDLHKSIQTQQTRIQELEGKYSQHVSVSNPLSLRVSELEAGLKTMADNVLQKQAHIERVAAERSALRLQLDQEIAKTKSLETRLQEAQHAARTAAAASAAAGGGDDLDDDDLDFDVERGVGGGVRARRSRLDSGRDRFHFQMPLQIAAGSSRGAVAVARAVGFLDSMGAQAGFILRRHPAIRLGFGLYFIMLHLWVVFVLLHFMNHPMAESHTD